MRTPVYAVAAIMGSTEQGAVDLLAEILALRSKYQAKGLSFVVHRDGAWGGYFASMLRELPSGDLNSPAFVPSLSLQEYTRTQLEKYPEADSITIDPHKSGYCPYPAGGLRYRDEHMRFLITCTSPVVVHSQDDANECIGAAAVGAYLSHQVIGLNYLGYGALLGEATFTCTKLYSHWATMTADNDPKLVVVPFNMLPAEKGANPTPEKIALRRKAMALLEKLGSDRMINAFACNFKINGKINEDIVVANYLNNRIFSRLSVMTVDDVVGDRPMILTSSIFEQSAYKGCLDNFKRRLGLKGEQDLFVLVNLVKDLDVIAREEIEACILRNTVYPDKHGFVMQGTDKLHLIHLPMFNMANHRYQAIITSNLPPDVIKKYTYAKKQNPHQFFVLGNNKNSILPDLLKEGAAFKATIFEGLPSDHKPLCTDFVISNIHVVVDESLSSNALDTVYPAQMPFYLYETPAQPHVDHVLRVSPSIQLNSDRVTLELAGCLTQEQLVAGVVAVFTDVLENSMQPIVQLSSNKDYTKFESQCFSFVSGAKFAVSIFEGYKTSQTPGATPLTEGIITLGTSVYADDTDINMDPGIHVKKGRLLLIGGLRAGTPSLGKSQVAPPRTSPENAHRYRRAVSARWGQEWKHVKSKVRKEGASLLK